MGKCTAFNATGFTDLGQEKKLPPVLVPHVLVVDGVAGIFDFRDRFDKTRFRPKTFRINIHPQMFDKCSTKTDINLSDCYGQ
jgi:hypothetical protein